MSAKNLSEKASVKIFISGRNLILIICFALLSGCVQYQYFFIDSHLPQNDDKEFIAENDTVMIKYKFSGENLPITLTICNKLSKPLYIDWEESAVIINDVQINDAFALDDQISYIAPLSNVTVFSNKLQNQFVLLDLNDPNARVALVGGNSSMVKFSYKEESSPLFFRSILALATDENYSTPTFFDYSFWASDIIKTSEGPTMLGYSPPNQFHIRKETGFGKFMGWTGTLAALIVLAAISPGE
jgi:hypothetical protein